MLDLVIGGISVSILLGLVYWIQKTFVCEKTCQARQDCIEGKIDKLHRLTKQEFGHVRELLDNLIKRH